MDSCYATGDVTTGLCSGGLVGTYDESKMTNCVGLNKNVSGRAKLIGTASNTPSVNPRLSNSFARTDMTLGMSCGLPSSSFNRTYSGTNITATQWNSATWWQNTAKFSASFWEFRAGLPRLKNMPGIDFGVDGLAAQNPVVNP